MYLNFRSLFMPLLIGAVAVSCEQNELEEVTPIKGFTSEGTSLATSANILYQEDFEGSTFFSGVRQQFGTEYAFSPATDPVYNGSKSGRFELRDTDPMTSGGTRAEVLFPTQENQNRWYSFAVYFPSEYFQIDSKQDVISQWHQGGGVNPSSSLRIKNDKLLLDVRKEPGSSTKISLGPLVKDAWQSIVVHIKHSHESDGLVEIWQNGVKVVNYVGPNSYDSSYDLPRWKMGIYKSDWNYSETTDTKKRILYFDDVRMGDENATYSDMVSDVSTAPAPTEPEPTPEPTPTEPAPSPGDDALQVVSFTLINADSDEEIMTITDGATLSLSSFGTKKVTIRANTSPSTVGSVKFALSGAESRNGTDKNFPYALFGDNKEGNYYYGSWNPPTTGSYTLKATPYADADDQGTAGISQTVSFTFTK